MIADGCRDCPSDSRASDEGDRNSSSVRGFWPLGGHVFYPLGGESCLTDRSKCSSSSFPAIQFTGEIAPALADLVENGIIRVIDLLFVSKGDNGTVEVVEIADLGDDVYGEYGCCRL